MIALVGLGDQLVDLAVGNLGQNAVAFADGQQNRIQHGVHAANDFGICALELLPACRDRRAALPSRLRSAAPIPSAGPAERGHVVDGLLHLFVIALVCLAISSSILPR